MEARDVREREAARRSAADAPAPARSPLRELATRLSSQRRILLPVAILAGSLAVAAWLLQSGPKAERGPRPLQARLVEVRPVELTSQRANIPAMGVVVAAREIALEPDVAGRVVEVSPDFVPGGHFAKGELLLRVDPRDYELTLRQRESALARTRATLQLEEGNQSIARREYEILGESIGSEDRDLVLRKPQLDSVRAEVAAAEAALSEARLQLTRTRVEAPFDALVRTRGVELGARVAPGTPVATLVATDVYWVELALPVSQLRFVTLPAEGRPGAAVLLSDEAAWGAGVVRVGHVARLLGDLEPEGRMARLLVEVDDPLSLRPENVGLPTLLVGAYVHGEIEGPALEQVVALDRNLLRDGDRVFVMNAQDQLEIRSVEVAFRGGQHVLVSKGLSAGERVVISELSAPVTGMPLRTPEMDAGEGAL